MREHNGREIPAVTTTEVTSRRFGIGKQILFSTIIIGGLLLAFLVAVFGVIGFLVFMISTH